MLERKTIVSLIVYTRFLENNNDDVIWNIAISCRFIEGGKVLFCRVRLKTRCKRVCWTYDWRVIF